LHKDADGSQVIDNINKGLYNTFEQAKKAVDAVNEQFEDKQKIQILNKDCQDMLAEIEDGSVDCVIADPPYNITDNDWDKFDSEESFLGLIDAMANEFKRVLKDGGPLFLFADQSYFCNTESILKKNVFEITSRLVWVRKNIADGRSPKKNFIKQWEPVFYCGGKDLNYPTDWGDERGDVKEYALPQSNFKEDKGIHPTQKPLELIRQFVELSTDIGELIIDPFCGAGTTAKACEELNRRCITCDTNQEYIEKAKIRVFGDK